MFDFLKKLFSQKNLGKLRYKVISPGELIQEKYHNSTGYFFREEILTKGQQPKGVYFIGGGDENIDVAYDIGLIGRLEIEKFIKSFGIEVEFIK